MQLFTDNDLKQSLQLSDKTRLMMMRLAELGCPKDLLACFLSMDNFKADHVRFLTGPVIQHRSPWAESTPRWLYRAIPAERLAIIFDEHEQGITGWQIGPAELTAVMYPATMEAPMRTEYADIYLWAAAQANAAHQGKSIDDIWQQTGAPVDGKLMTAPGGRCHHDYKQLCADIRRRIIKAAPSTRSNAKSNVPAPDCTQEQLPLF